MPLNDDDLQFDRVASPDASAEPELPAVVCASCRTPLTTEYFDVSGTPFCAACKAGLEQHLADSHRSVVLGKAALFGLGGAIAGAAVYFAVGLFFQIGIVAILVGYMVGYAVRKGSGGVGGRR